MPNIARDYLFGIISSVTAAILLSVIGFSATKLGHKNKRSPETALRWIRLSDQRGSIREGLRASHVFLAFILALAMTAGTALLPSGVAPMESKPPDAYYFEADNAIRMATLEADSNFRVTENDVANTLRNADQQAESIRDTHDPKASYKIKRIAAQATAHAEQLRKWNEQRNAELLKSAEQRAETLRAQATQRDISTRLKIGTRIAVFSEATLWGLLLIFYAGHLAKQLELAQPKPVGFLAAGTMVLGIAVCSSLSGSFGVVNLFEPFLIASALYISLEQGLSFAEALLNSGYVVFQRFYSAVAIALTGALAALVSASGLFGLIYIVYKAVTDDDSLDATGLSPLPFPRLTSMYYLLNFGALVTFMDFFQLFASALCLAAFFSVLAGREKPPEQPAYDFSDVDLSGNASHELVDLRLPPIRRLLLIYRPVGIRAWVAHLLFYLTLALVFARTRLFGAGEWDENVAVASLLLFLLVIAFCFRYWAVSELGWRTTTAPRIHKERSWTPRPSSGRELTARVFAVIAGAKAVQCFCLLVLVFFVQDDSSTLADVWPTLAIWIVSMTYVCVFCRRWARTEAVLSTLWATRMPQRYLFLLKPTGLSARFAILTFYVFLGWAILHIVRPMFMLGLEGIDPLNWSSAASVADIAMLLVLIPLYAGHSWASAESARAIAAAIPSHFGEQQSNRNPPIS